jgi:hypothetical protein
VNGSPVALKKGSRSRRGPPFLPPLQDGVATGHPVPSQVVRDGGTHGTTTRRPIPLHEPAVRLRGRHLSERRRPSYQTQRADRLQLRSPHEAGMVPTDLDSLAPTGISLRRPLMALRTGDIYRCPDERCGCVMEVTKGSAVGTSGAGNPRCTCGKEMSKESKVVRAQS